jgi:hypothetical protein
VPAAAVPAKTDRIPSKLIVLRVASDSRLKRFFDVGFLNVAESQVVDALPVGHQRVVLQCTPVVDRPLRLSDDDRNTGAGEFRRSNTWHPRTGDLALSRIGERQLGSGGCGERAGTRVAS